MRVKSYEVASIVYNNEVWVMADFPAVVHLIMSNHYFNLYKKEVDEFWLRSRGFVKAFRLPERLIEDE